MNQLRLDGDAGVLADPVHVVGDPGVHVGEDLRLAARARHEGGHAKMTICVCKTLTSNI